MTKPEDSSTAFPIWAVYALTKQGAEVALRTAAGLNNLGGASVFLPERLKVFFPGATAYFESSREIIASNFGQFNGHVVVGATGLVVRHIAPLLKSKKIDPAVVVLSQDGRWSISLLSGHLGGGNELAQMAADILGAQAVITTATDVARLPAVEMLAREADLEIEDFANLPAVSRRLVEDAELPVYDPGSFLRPFLAPWSDHFQIIDQEDKAVGPHIRVDYRLEAAGHPEALVMRPKILALGLGCHKGLPPQALESFVKTRLREASLAEKSVAVLATVEIRRDEPAMTALSQAFNRPLIIYTKAELESVATPNPSATVLRRIGVPSVCEAAALLAAGADQLLIDKQKSDGCTLAAAILSQPD